MSPSQCIMIVEESTFVCDECDEDGYILIMQELPVKEGRHLRKTGSKCWNHFTPELMALPEVRLI